MAEEAETLHFVGDNGKEDFKLVIVHVITWNDNAEEDLETSQQLPTVLGFYP